jgi:hypothetical protein
VHLTKGDCFRVADTKKDGKLRTALKWLLGAMATAIIGALVVGPLQSGVNRSTNAILELWDGAMCGGHAASNEGDRLSELASQDPKQARERFHAANEQYRIAYFKCGLPDAGLRLAVAHCIGLGEPKDVQQARHLVLEIESKFPEKIGRAGDVRRACGF